MNRKKLGRTPLTESHESVKRVNVRLPQSLIDRINKDRSRTLHSTSETIRNAVMLWLKNPPEQLPVDETGIGSAVVVLPASTLDELKEVATRLKVRQAALIRAAITAHLPA